MQENSKRLSSIETLLTIFVILLCVGFGRAQQKETESYIPVPDTAWNYKEPNESVSAQTGEVAAEKIEKNQDDATSPKRLPEKALSTIVKSAVETNTKERDFDKPSIKEVSFDEPVPKGEGKERFHWKPALIQSGIFLGFQHAFRMTQAKTRRELGGPFFRDWAQSVKNLRGWKDQDNLFTNYVAHPLQGGLTGRIFVNNSDRAKKQEFGKSKKYWESRFKAMAWSAVWSTQFELGPISEASIGNVGIRDKRGGPTMAWGDLVVTPIVGTGVVIAEDFIDKYILKNWIEKKISNKTVIKMFRIMLMPTTSVANVLRARRPSLREDRPL